MKTAMAKVEVTEVIMVVPMMGVTVVKVKVKVNLEINVGIAPKLTTWNGLFPV